MKKTYRKPTIIIVEVNLDQCLAAGITATGNPDPSLKNTQTTTRVPPRSAQGNFSWSNDLD